MPAVNMKIANGSSSDELQHPSAARLIIDALNENREALGVEDAKIGAAVIIGATLRWALDAEGAAAARALLAEVEEALDTAIARESAAPLGRPN